MILKSFPNGILVILDGTISFQELLADIAAKFREADGFFKDASVAISIEGRELTEEQEREILDAITQNSRLKILCLMGKDEEKNLKFLGVQNKLNFQNDENSGQFYRGTLRMGRVSRQNTVLSFWEMSVREAVCIPIRILWCLAH